MNAGDTMLIPLPSTSVDSHLWMVISDPVQSDVCLLVNFASWRHDKDQACVLMAGEHPYVNKQTCVNYHDAKLCKTADLDQLILSGRMKAHIPLSQSLLIKIRAAVPESRITQAHAQMLVDQGLVEF